MKASISIAASVLALGLIGNGCKGKDNDGKTIQQIPTELKGDYKTDCQSNSVLNLTSSLRSLSFSAVGDFDKSEDYYVDNGCSDGPALTYKVSGTAQNIGEDPQHSGQNLINFSVNTAEIKPGTQAVVDALNTASFCGKKDWAVGVSADISGASCPDGFTIKKGDVIQDVYEDQGGTLYFGKKFALLLVETGDRPAEVDTSIPYHKQ